MWKDKYRYNIITHKWDLIETEHRIFSKVSSPFQRDMWVSKGMLKMAQISHDTLMKQLGFGENLYFK